RALPGPRCRCVLQGLPRRDARCRHARPPLVEHPRRRRQRAHRDRQVDGGGRQGSARPVDRAGPGPERAHRTDPGGHRLRGAQGPETERGRATTDAHGVYQISYDADVLLRLGEPRADLAVTALDASGAQLAEAPVVFQAPATVEVDVTVGGATYLGPPEADTL